MDPVTILELTGTVLSLSIKIYDFFNAVHDAPGDILEYLQTLELTRRVLEDVQDYLRRHVSSSFRTHDELELGIVQRTLEDCKLEFALQLSYIESLDPSMTSSFFRRAVRKTKFVLSEEKIEAFTQKLQKVQGLLNLAIATTTGKNTILIRDKLEIVSFEVHEVYERSEAESLARDQLLVELQQYAVVLQDSAKEFLQLAKDTHTRSDTRMTDLSQSFSIVDSSVRAPMTTTDGASDPAQGSEDPLKPSNAMLEQLQESQARFKKAIGSRPKDTSTGLASTTTDPVMGIAATWEDVMSICMKQQDLGTSKWNPRHNDFVSRLSQFTDILPSQYDGVVSGSLKLIVSFAAQSRSDMSFLVEAMEEWSEAIEMCRREQALYQDPKLTRMIERLYLDLLEISNVLLNAYERSRVKRLSTNPGNFEHLAQVTTKIRRTSDSVRWEVDYQHRLEMRRTSNRIVEMQREQHRMISMLEDQKRILHGMEEERRVMGVIQGQQEILQVVRQIQHKLQAEGDRGVSQ